MGEQAAELNPNQDQTEIIYRPNDLVRDFYLSFQFSQGDFFSQKSFYQYMHWYYFTHNIQIDEIFSKAEQIALKISPPAEHIQKDKNEIQNVAKEEWDSLKNIVLTKSPIDDLQKNLLIERILSDFIDLDTDRIGNREGHKDKNKKFESYFKTYILNLKSTNSLVFDSLCKELQTKILAIKDYPNDEITKKLEFLIRKYNRFHPGESFFN